MVCQDIYLKYTPAKGTPVIRHHRVWDKDRFLKARIEEGASCPKLEDRFTIMPVDRPPFEARKV